MNIRAGISLGASVLAVGAFTGLMVRYGEDARHMMAKRSDLGRTSGGLTIVWGGLAMYVGRGLIGKGSPVVNALVGVSLLTGTLLGVADAQGKY